MHSVRVITSLAYVHDNKFTRKKRERHVWLASTCLHSAAAVMVKGAVKAVCVLAAEQSVLTARRVILEDARTMEMWHVLTPVTKTLLTTQADPMS